MAVPGWDKLDEMRMRKLDYSPIMLLYNYGG